MSTHYDEVCRRSFRELTEEKDVTGKYVWGKRGDSGVAECRISPAAYFDLYGDEHAILNGEEVMMECAFKSARTNAFAQAPQDSVMRIGEIQA